MAYKDQETARAAARRFREANPGYGRAQYAKHAEKRRAVKVDAYHADLDASRASQRERYARNAETVRKQQADYRGRNRAALVQQQSAWREANPEKEELHRAKRALMIQTGVRMRDIPADLAEAKAIAISIKREIENLRKSSSLYVQPKGPPMSLHQEPYQATAARNDGTIHFTADEGEENGPYDLDAFAIVRGEERFTADRMAVEGKVLKVHFPVGLREDDWVQA